MPASDPWAWAPAHMRARLAASSSSQMREETDGIVSESALTGAYSVHTAAHPPSAFIDLKWAWEAGFSVPKPVQWGTW